MDMVEVCNKKTVPDVFGQEIRRNIIETGIDGIEEVLASEIYRFEGISSLDELTRIAGEILVDAVAQDYFIGDSNVERRHGYKVVDVFYRKGVTDSVSDTVVIAIRDASIRADISVSTGKRYYLKGNITDKDIGTICEKVLVNPLVQEYVVAQRKGKNE